jgi:hypothetical protein
LIRNGFHGIITSLSDGLDEGLGEGAVELPAPASKRELLLCL